MYIQLTISVWCDGNRVWELQQDCYSYALTIATGDIIEIEEVVKFMSAEGLTFSVVFPSLIIPV